MSEGARQRIADLGNHVFVSSASLWEIAVKTSLGRLTPARPFAELIPEQLRLNAMEVLPIEVPHLAALITFPWHHRDPVDRLLISQASAEGHPIVSRDTVFPAYPVQVLW